MSHHSSGSDQEMSEETLKHFAEAGQKVQKEVYNLLRPLGPTGKFPHGHLTDQDEGEIGFVVFNKDNKVVIDFNHPVHWLGMTKEQANELGRLLIKRAKKIK